MAFAQLDAPRAARSLLTISAVVDRCAVILSHGEAGRLAAVRVVPDALDGLGTKLLAALPATPPQARGHVPMQTAAHEIFATLLPQAIADTGSPIILGGIALGDCALHPLMKRGDASDGIIAFHAVALSRTLNAVMAGLATGRTIEGSERLPAAALPQLLSVFQLAGALVIDEDADPVAARAVSVALAAKLRAAVAPRLPEAYAAWPVAALLVAASFMQENEDDAPLFEPLP